MANARQRLRAAFPGLRPIGGPLVRSYLLIDPDHGATLIDSGLLWEPRSVKRELAQADMGLEDLTTILLTHGHLDHTANLRWYRDHTKAKILAHPLEQIHIDGAYPYTRANRLCHALEAIGRRLLRYQPVQLDGHLEANTTLDLWGGLQVISLPGHTAGHCGFYSKRHDLLFTGDFFASYLRKAALPPAGLNACPDRFPEAIATIRELNPRWILPNHAWFLDHQRLQRQFQALLLEL